MPYATFGLAVGRMDITRTVVVTPSATAATPPGTFVPPPITVSENLTNQFGYGWAAGFGTDFCLMANLFLRAEYEYVQSRTSRASTRTSTMCGSARRSNSSHQIF